MPLPALRVETSKVVGTAAPVALAVDSASVGAGVAVTVAVAVAVTVSVAVTVTVTVGAGPAPPSAVGEEQPARPETAARPRTTTPVAQRNDDVKRGMGVLPSGMCSGPGPLTSW
ncbi:hypothetical protein [Salana multivorans]